MNSGFAHYAERAVPRYTSYPTAPHFRPDFGEATYRAWLSTMDESAPISLYLHVPFCRQMCWYCGCNMKLVKREGPLDEYVETLLTEIRVLSQALGRNPSVSQVHWGGGTPTALSPVQLGRVMSALRDAFDVLPDAEIAIESDPRTLTDDYPEKLAAMGFTRASFGVQEFDPKVQAAINRVQPPEMVANCVDRFRRNGFSSINFDLIYGLPHQTTEMLLRTIDLSTEMSPDRVALFGYAHVPWMAKNQRMIDQADLPGAEARADQASRAAKAIVASGYHAIGIDHFALPHDGLARAAANGTLRRNFQGYTDDPTETLIGIGPTSIGYTLQGYVQNIADTHGWARAVQAGRLPVAKGIAFSGQDKLRGAVIEQIMCHGRVDLPAVGEAHVADADWWFDDGPRLNEMIADGVIEIEDGVLTVTPSGAPFRRVVASAFDQYLAQSEARHSVAV